MFSRRLIGRHINAGSPLRSYAPLATKRRVWQLQSYRSISLNTITAILTPPAVFGGLLVALWTYKCLMMVIFQNKIIYMPSVPPFSRAETVADYESMCRPVEWREHEIVSGDGTKLKLLEGSIIKSAKAIAVKDVVIVYFQGNASSLPPRLPHLSRILSMVQPSDDTGLSENVNYIMVALSYRGFWKSSGRPTQPGIELDARAAIDWVLSKYDDQTTRVILWGQSIGAGAASVALSNLAHSPNGPAKMQRISGLLLETPFVNLRAMLVALYPQRFLPYRYLAPFLRSTWDSERALSVIGDAKPPLRVLIVQAGSDELVPFDNAETLEILCKRKGLGVERLVIGGALHTEVLTKSQGRSAIADFIRRHHCYVQDAG